MGCTIAGGFIVRTPLFASGTITAVLARPSVSDAELARLFADPLVQEAIVLASPVLYDEVRRWLDGGLSRPDEASGIRRSLLKYLIRMCTRSTPFGLFAGCSTGSFGRDLQGTLSPRSAMRRSARLDMGVFCALAQRLAASADIRRGLTLFPNSTLYIVGQEARFFEYWYDEKHGRHYRLVSVEVNPYLRLILERARAGAGLDDLAHAAADGAVSVEDAARYVNDLIDNQVLATGLDPAVTDPRFLESAIAQLSGSTADDRRAAERIGAALHACGDDAPTRGYDAVRSAVSTLAPRPASDAVVQVDVFKPSSLTLSEEVKSTLLAGLAAINRLTPRAPLERLEKFRAAFRARFEDRPVPLLLALDAEVGVPYGRPATTPSALLEGLEAEARAGAEPDTIALGAVERWLLPTIWDALLGDRDEARLDEADLARWPLHWDDLPPTFTVMFSVVSAGDRPRLWLRGAGGATAAAALGRFAHLDESIRAQADAIAAHERACHPGRIVAEVLHLPDDRVGNVLIRPALRAHEIPCLARPSVDRAHVVPLDDLSIAVPHAGPVRLRSIRLGCDVIPMLSNSHRYDSDELLPAYRLLCDLQAQGSRVGLGLPVDRLSRVVPRLPRIVHGGCILSPARWRFDGREIDRLVPRLRGPADAFREWQRRQRLPDEVLLSEMDHELYLNLANADCRDLLAGELRQKKTAVLIEYPFAESSPWIAGEDGGYCHEVMAACFRGPAGSDRDG